MSNTTDFPTASRGLFPVEKALVPIDDSLTVFAFLFERGFQCRYL